MCSLQISYFSDVYDEVKKESEAIWRYEKQEVYGEYQNKPYLPVPFSILPNIYYILFGRGRRQQETQQKCE